MHELSICNALIDMVERIARDHDAASVDSIVVKVGPLSGVEARLLRNAYPLAAAGTVAEHATLLIEEADVVVRCGTCGSESTVLPNRLLCTECGDFRTRIVSGDEMVLQRVELGRTGAPRTAPALSTC